MWYIPKIEYYSTIKGNKLLIKKKVTNESRNNCTEQKKPDKKVYIYDYIYI